MVGEWMMDSIKIPWFRHPRPSWYLVYLVRGGSRPNLTEGSLPAAMADGGGNDDEPDHDPMIPSSRAIVVPVRGDNRPNPTEGSLSAVMGCVVQGYLVDLGWVFV
ncbi:hypothetical protein M5K25_009352 [Dendrobium thyrsiflorum]|uniref:Uncharacterized protein n=1 Tax=Dendrobium thyrsiflorum TaxID=117978 RepID=A0ABD0VC45_DENTH